jgi:actin-like protein 6A
MQQTIEDKGTAVMPRYSIKREEKGGTFTVETLDFPKTTDSFRSYHVDAICQDAKHVICRVSDNPFNPEENANIPNVTYELPDGQEIQIGPQRFSIPELLFNPTLAKGFGEVGNDMLSQLPEAGAKGLPQLVTECIDKCDVDARRELYNGIVLTGGTSLFTSLRERIEKEVTNMAPSMMKVRVTSPANPIERRYSTWIGGSILSSLGTFQQMWMSKSEYKEHGSGLIHKKAP